MRGISQAVLYDPKQPTVEFLGQSSPPQFPGDSNPMLVKVPVGTRVQGKVVSITNYGAFVEIEPGIDGLIHISDMSWTKRVQHPSEVVKKGDAVDVVILNIDAENKRISLGLKQAEEDPWLKIGENYPVNMEHTYVQRSDASRPEVQGPGGRRWVCAWSAAACTDRQPPADNAGSCQPGRQRRRQWWW